MSSPVANALRALADALEREPRAVASAPDALVALDATGLERAAVRRLVREGRLRVAKIGRRRFVRRSELLAVHDALAAEQAAKATTTKVDAYADVVSMATRRRGGT